MSTKKNDYEQKSEQTDYYTGESELLMIFKAADKN
jgi:hypothetical protein